MTVRESKILPTRELTVIENYPDQKVLLFETAPQRDHHLPVPEQGVSLLCEAKPPLKRRTVSFLLTNNRLRWNGFLSK
jgi:hypothetical protein